MKLKFLTGKFSKSAHLVNRKSIRVFRRPYHAKNPFLAKIIENKELFDGKDRSCRFISLDLTNSALRYQPGDHCGIYAPNNLENVEKLEKLLNIDFDAVIDAVSLNGFFDFDWDSIKMKPFPLPSTIRTAFTYYLDITSPVSLDLLMELSQIESNTIDGQIIQQLIDIENQVKEISYNQKTLKAQPPKKNLYYFIKEKLWKIL